VSGIRSALELVMNGFTEEDIGREMVWSWIGIVASRCMKRFGS
jgi:hypothetical protein